MRSERDARRGADVLIAAVRGAIRGGVARNVHLDDRFRLRPAKVLRVALVRQVLPVRAADPENLVEAVEADRVGGGDGLEDRARHRVAVVPPDARLDDEVADVKPRTRVDAA